MHVAAELHDFGDCFPLYSALVERALDLKSVHDHAVMGFIMRQKRLPLPEMHHAFAAAAETLALFCRLRDIDAGEVPAQDIDTLLDIAFEEAAQQAAAREEARRFD
jgi:cobyrinic acid a,c-diamide synthase